MSDVFVKREDVLKAIIVEWEAIKYHQLDPLNALCNLKHKVEHMEYSELIEKNAATINGYPMTKLWGFARACEEMNVTNEDLKALCHNVQFAHDAYHKDMELCMQRMIESFTSKTIKVEPDTVEFKTVPFKLEKGEDDGNTDTE